MTAIPQPTLEADFRFAAEGEAPFRLQAGGELPSPTLRYTIYGSLSPQRDNVVLVCHALSGSARVAEWWAEMFGPGKCFDLERDCVIGTNVIGSCYGSTGPTSTDTHTGTPYGPTFPMVTVSDMVRAQALLMNHLGVQRLRSVIGGSIGGMQALQWAVDYPDRVQACVLAGATPLSAMGLALNHLQRLAIQNDPEFQGGFYSTERRPVKGLGIARALAMCSYKSAELFDSRYGRRPNRNGEDPYASAADRFDVAGYLDYQGTEFNTRFDANTYLTILKAMDTFDLARCYGTEQAAFARIQAKVLLVGISSDWLFPDADVRALFERMRAAGVDARYARLVSSHGHDAFLADAEELSRLIQEQSRFLLSGNGETLQSASSLKPVATKM